VMCIEAHGSCDVCCLLFVLVREATSRLRVGDEGVGGGGSRRQHRGDAKYDGVSLFSLLGCCYATTQQ